MNRTETDAAALAGRLKQQVRNTFVGADQPIELLLTGFFGGLHVLIEDIPGVGKTTMARSLAVAAGLDFGRIQFTPDLLPGDITGVTVWSQESRSFVFKSGSVMHQFVLADEINRASSRTQAALLESMQEESVTVDGVTYPLPKPFTVVATQNPLTFTGTFPLPEAQIDRFGLSISLGYPNEADEMEILDQFAESDPYAGITAVTDAAEIVEIRKRCREVRVDPKIKRYLVDIAEHTRKHPLLRLGMSPRATQHLLRAAQAHAILSGRAFVIPEDVLIVGEPVLRHRLIATAEARMENKTPAFIVQEILSRVAKPTGL